MKVITVTLNPALDYTIHTDAWERGLVNRVDTMDFACGGKGLKVAVNLTIAGIPTSATGFMGAMNDQRFIDLFKQKGVQDDFIRVQGKETRRNIKIVDAQGETTDFNLTGIAPTPEQVQEIVDLIDKQIQEADVLMFGGSLPPKMDKNFYADMVKRYRPKGKLIVVDTSGSALTGLLNADALPDFVKPNIHELREFSGQALETDAEIIALARSFIAKGMKLFVVSMGGDGAWFVTADQAIHAQPPKVDIVSTVGAGDAMVAGVIRGFLNGDSLEDMAKTATAFGASNVENPSSFISTRYRIESLRDAVILKKFEG